MNKLVLYFVPVGKQADPEILRRYKLVINGLILTSLFVLNDVGISTIIRFRAGILADSLYILYNTFILQAIRRKMRLSLATNLYLLGGMISLFVSAYYSGGFHSSATPWLVAPPFVGLLLAGRKTGFVWLIVSIIFILILGVMSRSKYAFPYLYDQRWDNFFAANNYIGLIMLIFFVAVVLENGRTTALAELNKQNLLLAEEKKKNALYNLSQELHDNIGQTLSLVKVNLHTAQWLKDEKLQVKISDTLELVAKAIKDVREISHGLNAENLSDFNIVQAIKEQITSILKIGNYLADFAVTGSHRKMSPQTEFILFRIVQEVINNIIKHSEAKSIRIAAHYDTHQFSLTIDDDGIGIAQEKLLEGGQGLRTMRSRAELIGGVLSIRSEVNEGTSICVKLPMLISNIKQNETKHE